MFRSLCCLNFFFRFFRNLYCLVPFSYFILKDFFLLQIFTLKGKCLLMILWNHLVILKFRYVFFFRLRLNPTVPATYLAAGQLTASAVGHMTGPVAGSPTDLV